MSYFKYFPTIPYRIGKGKDRLAKDIVRSVRFLDAYIEDPGSSELYTVKEGETPDIVSFNVYGSTKYHWLILLFNNMIDPILDFPLSEDMLDSYLDKRYPGKAVFIDLLSGDFKRNDTVFYGPNSSYRALVHSYDPTLRKLVLLKETGPIVSNQTIFVSANNAGLGIAKRIVDIHKYALYRFEWLNSESIFNPYSLPPGTPDAIPNLGLQIPIGTQTAIRPIHGGNLTTIGTPASTRPDPDTEIFEGDIVDDGTPTDPDNPDTIQQGGFSILDGYIDGLNTTTAKAVTIHEYYFRENDKRRTIRILKPQYLGFILDEFKDLIDA